MILYPAETASASMLRRSSRLLQRPHVHHAPDTIPLLHDVERLVDLAQRLSMRDELVHLERTGHVVAHEVGQLRATLDPTKRTALPHSTRHQLEGWTTIRQYFGTEKRASGRLNARRVAISRPAAATPMMTLWPHPLWHASNAARMTPTFPVQSKV